MDRQRNVSHQPGEVLEKVSDWSGLVCNPNDLTWIEHIPLHEIFVLSSSCCVGIYKHACANGMNWKPQGLGNV